MKRLEYLDYMKGMAIFLMVMGHVLIFTFGVNSCALEKVFFINMPIFFYVSGYLLYKEIDNGRDLLCRLGHKAVRLLPPWLAVTLAMTMVQKWNFFSTLCKFYWFFYVLFVLTFLLIVLEYFVFRRIRNSYLYCASLFVIPVLFAGIKFMGWGADGYFPAPYFCQYSIPFIFGWICHKYVKVNKFVLENQIIFVIATIGFVVCWVTGVTNNYVRLLGALCGIIMLQSVLYQRELAGKNMKLVSLIGRSTLAIYALNNFFLPDFRQFVDVSWIIGNGLVVEIVAVGIVAAAVIACCLLVETVFHCNKYLSKLL